MTTKKPAKKALRIHSVGTPSPELAGTILAKGMKQFPRANRSARSSESAATSTKDIATSNQAERAPAIGASKLLRDVERIVKLHVNADCSQVLAFYVYQAIKQYHHSEAGKRRARAPREQAQAAKRIAAAATRAAKIIKQEASKDLPGFDTVKTLDIWAHHRTGKSLLDMASDLETIAKEAEQHSESARRQSAKNLDNQLTPVIRIASLWASVTRTLPEFAAKGKPSAFVGMANALLPLFRPEVTDSRTIVKDGLIKWHEDYARGHDDSL